MDRVAEEPPSAPAKGPAWLAAEAYGIDMSQVAHALRQPVWERIQHHRSALSLALMLKKAYEEQHGRSGGTA
jgi:hypothetical protein